MRLRIDDDLCLLIDYRGTGIALNHAFRPSKSISESFHVGNTPTHQTLFILEEAIVPALT